MYNTNIYSIYQNNIHIIGFALFLSIFPLILSNVPWSSLGSLSGAPSVPPSLRISLSAASPVTHFLLPSCSLVSLVFLNDFARISADCAASRVGQPSDIPCPHLAPGLGHLAPLRYTQTSSNCVGTAQKPLVFKGLYRAKVHDISTWISTFFLFPKVKRACAGQRYPGSNDIIILHYIIIRRNFLNVFHFSNHFLSFHRSF